MKRTVTLLILLLLLGVLCSCAPQQDHPQIVATTLPVYEFTAQLCAGTDLSVGRLVNENVSCLHDYSLQTAQMRMLEGAQWIVISGAGLEDFLELDNAAAVINASEGIELLCPAEEHHHEHTDHAHESDPHIWLSVENAKTMCQNICQGLCQAYPENAQTFKKNLDSLSEELRALQAYADDALSRLSTRELITFHDGFAYFADAFDLTILKAVEEESGSEASAAELIELIGLVEQHDLPAIFTERNGSVSAADIIADETGTKVFTLDMAMGETGYFDAMYHNINTVKEALE